MFAYPRVMLPFVVPAVQWAWSSRCGCDVLAAVRSTARPSGASTGARCSSPGVVQSRSPFRPPGLRPPLGRRSSAAARSSRPQVFAARGQSDSAQRGSRPRARVLKYLSSLLESARVCEWTNSSGAKMATCAFPQCRRRSCARSGANHCARGTLLAARLSLRRDGRWKAYVAAAAAAAP